jgi:hypothetical protein
VLDLELPDTDGFEFLKELEAIYALRFEGLEGHTPGYSPFTQRLDLTLSWYPTASFVVVSERQGYDIFEHVSPENHIRGVPSRAFAAGAVGFIPKSSSRETMLDAFRTIFAGGLYFAEPNPPPVDPV